MIEKKELNSKKVTLAELEKISGGASEPRTHPTVIPVSLAICPTTKCASVVRPCNG